MAIQAAQPPTVLDPQEKTFGELYASALLAVLPTDDEAEAIFEELQAIMDLARSDEAARVFLQGLALSHEQQSHLVERVFGGRVSEKTEAFLGVLARHGRLLMLRPAVWAMRRLLDQREGKLDVMLVTASELSDADREKVTADLSSMLKKVAMLHVRVDESLLGGAVLRIGDQVYDASLRKQLQKVREQIIARQVRTTP